MEAPYAINCDEGGQELIHGVLQSLVGETVCVSYTTTRNDMLGERDNFEPQISVQAKLEYAKERYRALVDDNTYSYFYGSSVWSMGQDVGKRAIIYIA